MLKNFPHSHIVCRYVNTIKYEQLNWSWINSKVIGTSQKVVTESKVLIYLAYQEPNFKYVVLNIYSTWGIFNKEVAQKAVMLSILIFPSLFSCATTVSQV
jgi:hypothetical protein